MPIVMVRLPTIETKAEEDDGRNVGQEEEWERWGPRS